MEEDRHKLKLVYMSAAEKRKLTKEKGEKTTEIISKIKRTSTFL